MGPRGKFVVAGFAIFEFFGGSCLTLMVLWRQVITILPADGGDGGSLLSTKTQHCTFLCCQADTTWNLDAPESGVPQVSGAIRASRWAWPFP